MRKRSDRRTTISLARVVWDMAIEMMDAKGFNDNFSAYVADLTRRDHETHAEASLRSFRRTSNRRWSAGGGAASLRNPKVETK